MNNYAQATTTNWDSTKPSGKSVHCHAELSKFIFKFICLFDISVHLLICKMGVIVSNLDPS